MRPRVEEREGIRIEWRAGRIQTDRIVDADEERLLRQRDRSARRAVGAQRAGIVVARLRGEQAGLERHDRLRLLRCEVQRRLRMPRASHRRPACARSCRIVVAGDDSRPSHMTALRKRRFVDGNGRRYIDAAVSGAPQWYGSSTLVDDELGAGGYVDADANEPAGEEQAEGGPALAERGHVGPFAVRPVVGAEDRIEPTRLVEAALDRLQA